MASVVGTHAAVDSQPHVLVRAMTRNPELCCLLVALIFFVVSRYGSSFKTKPITMPPKSPQHFFPPGSGVLDMYDGDIDSVATLIQTEELLFVMYYAPWCAQSMAVRGEFIKAANIMKNQVKFVAVNCWWPEGVCRKQYKFVMYPVFFAYHTHLDGYKYSDVLTADHMVRFIENVMYPITLLHEEQQIHDFLIKHETVALGYFNLQNSPQPLGFQQFYFAAMRTLETDPYQPVKFGVVVKKSLADLFDLSEDYKLLLLRLGNSSLHYPVEYNFTSSHIRKWILTYRQKPFVRWIVPIGRKSLVLSNEIKQGPAVILFSVLNPLFEGNAPFDELKYLSLEFSACENCTFHGASDTWRRLALQGTGSYRENVKLCEAFRQGQLKGVTGNSQCCISLLSPLESRPACLPSQLNVCEYCIHRDSQRSRGSRPCTLNMNLPSQALLQASNATFCQNQWHNCNVDEHSSLCCHKCHASPVPSDSDERVSSSSVPNLSFSGRPLRQQTDRYVIDSIEHLPRRLCRRLSLQKLQGLPGQGQDFSDSLRREALPENFTGLRCRHNRTVNFYAMDARNHGVFAERLGLNSSSLATAPAVVIVDHMRDEHFILRENVTVTSVAKFILNFTRGNLRRTLQSSLPYSAGCDREQGSLCVQELTSDNFLETAMQADKDVVVFVYAPWCGFCRAASHTYLAVSRYFQASSGIKFVRFNADKNDLPWEFTMERYPTILLFPARRKADSMVFPASQVLNRSNLIKFVLQHGSEDVRLETAVGVCSTLCIARNKEFARRTARGLQGKYARLLARYAEVTSPSDSNNGSQRVRQSANSVRQQIAVVKRKLSVTLKLWELLRTSSGSELQHSDLSDFLEESKALRGGG